jgi:hypothetical protein
MMLRPPLEPLQLHRGRSFVKHFTSLLRTYQEQRKFLWYLCCRLQEHKTTLVYRNMTFFFGRFRIEPRIQEYYTVVANVVIHEAKILLQALTAT